MRLPALSRGRWVAVAAVALVAAAGCRGSALRRSLSPGHADFLSKVRYIITRSEEKAFLGLPASQRDAFIDEFWKRRAPDPYASGNEFKDEYYSRLDEADRMFMGEGKPGWLTDRGRIYILFGPPIDRIINPLSRDPDEGCSEVWYYGGFPVLFRDPPCLGKFELVTADLSPIRELSLHYMHELSRAQNMAQSTYSRKREPLAFRGRLRISEPGPGRVEGVISLSIPYSGIWFDEPQVGSLLTTLEVEIELQDPKGRSRWSYREGFGVSAREEILEQEQGSAYSKDIPFRLDGKLGDMRREKLRFEVRLRNRTGGEEAQGVLKIPS